MKVLEAVAARVVPASAALDAAGRARFWALIDKTLASRPAGMRRQLALFLGVMRWAPVLRYGAPLEKLSGAEQDAVLRWFQSNPIPILRKGFWGVKTLALLGYYGQPENTSKIGYTPDFRGNGRL